MLPIIELSSCSYRRRLGRPHRQLHGCAWIARGACKPIPKWPLSVAQPPMSNGVQKYASLQCYIVPDPIRPPTARPTARGWCLGFTSSTRCYVERPKIGPDRDPTRIKQHTRLKVGSHEGTCCRDMSRGRILRAVHTQGHVAGISFLKCSHGGSCRRDMSFSDWFIFRSVAGTCRMNSSHEATLRLTGV